MDKKLKLKKSDESNFIIHLSVFIKNLFNKRFKFLLQMKLKKHKYIVGFIVLAMILGGCSKDYMTSIYNDNQKISSNENSFNIDVEEQNIEG